MNRYAYLDSPVGPLLVARDDHGITAVLWPNGRRPASPATDWIRADDAFDDLSTQLAEYFAGTRTEFDLPLHPSGTEFQLKVWNQLRRIPYGQTASYGETATALGLPIAACRAVGAANGQNPISIVVPCHRVIGANGTLTGYAGGLENKKWLLGHEAQHAGLFAAG